MTDESYRKQLARQHSCHRNLWPESGHGWPVKIFFSSNSIIVQNLGVGMSPKNVEDAGAPAAAWLTSKKHVPSPHLSGLPCRIWSFHIKRYKGTYGDTPKKMVYRVPPFKVSDGHRNRHGSIGTWDFLLVILVSLSRTVSEINDVFRRKSQFLPSPVFNVPLGVL